MWRVAGTGGEITVESGFRFDTARRIRLARKGEVIERSYPLMDNFSAQIAYFSECILSGKPPEADGDEELADMRAMLTIEQAARAGAPCKIAAARGLRYTSLDMARHFPPVTRRLLV